MIDKERIDEIAAFFKRPVHSVNELLYDRESNEGRLKTTSLVKVEWSPVDQGDRNAVETYFTESDYFGIYELCESHSTPLRKQFTTDIIARIESRNSGACFRVADFGSGICEESIALKHRHPQWIIDCYDLPDSQSLAFGRFRAARHGVDLSFYEVINDDPFEGKYDVILAFECLQHCFNPDGIVASAVDALQPDGRFLCTVRFDNPGYPALRQHAHLGDDEIFEAWMRGHGLAVVEKVFLWSGPTHDKHLFVFSRS